MRLLVAALALSALILSGCASPPDSSQERPRKRTCAQKLVRAGLDGHHAVVSCGRR